MNRKQTSIQPSIEYRDDSWIKVLTVCITILGSMVGVMVFLNKSWERQFDQLNSKVDFFKSDADKRFDKIDQRFDKIDEQLRDLLKRK